MDKRAICYLKTKRVPVETRFGWTCFHYYYTYLCNNCGETVITESKEENFKFCPHCGVRYSIVEREEGIYATLNLLDYERLCSLTDNDFYEGMDTIHFGKELEVSCHFSEWNGLIVEVNFCFIEKCNEIGLKAAIEYIKKHIEVKNE